MDAAAGEVACEHLAIKGVPSVHRVVEGCGHQIYYENPTGMVAAVREVCAVLAQGPGLEVAPFRSPSVLST